jgi:hypothetical protein
MKAPGKPGAFFSSPTSAMHDAESQMSPERVEITIAVQQREAVHVALCRDESVIPIERSRLVAKEIHPDARVDEDHLSRLISSRSPTHS